MQAFPRHQPQTCLCVNRDFNDRSRALGRSLRPTSLPQDGLAIFPSVEEVDFSRVPNVTDNVGGLAVTSH